MMIFVEGWVMIFVKYWMLIFVKYLMILFVEGWVIQQQKRNWHYRLSVIYAKVEVIWEKMTKFWDLVEKYQYRCIDDEINLAGLWPLQLQLTART